MDLAPASHAPVKPAWFEFILAPATLKSHLEKPNCDPTATDLITQFFANNKKTVGSNNRLSTAATAIIGGNNNNSNNNINNGNNSNNADELSLNPNSSPINANGQLQANSQVASSPSGTLSSERIAENAKYRAKKAHILKTLALKAASFLDWNIELFEKELSLPTQIELMDELKNVCNQQGTPEEYRLFATILHSRWFVRASISYRLSRIQPEITGVYNAQTLAPPCTNTLMETQIPSYKELNELFINDTSPVEELMKLLKDSNTDCTSKRIQNGNSSDSSHNSKVAKLMPLLRQKIMRPTIDCFEIQNSNDWDKGVPMDVQDFLEQATYDLGRYYFFGEMYKEAKDILQRIDIDNIVKYSLLTSYLQSSTDMLKSKTNTEDSDDIGSCSQDDEDRFMVEKIEDYLYGKQSQATRQKSTSDVEEGEISDMDEDIQDDNIADGEEDLDIRLTNHGSVGSNNNGSLLPAPTMSRIPLMTHMVATNNMTTVPPQQQQDQLAILATQDRDERFIPVGRVPPPITNLSSMDTQSKLNNPPDERAILTIKGELCMTRGEHTQAMGNFVEVLTMMTEYFTHFSNNHVEEENIINRMIQCSIKLGCFTQAVVLHQMTNNFNYGVAFKQLNERFCNDCCDDLYECIWDITLMEHIIHIHTKRGEIERKCRLIQLIGQLELNENNSEEILVEAMQSRRSRFFRIMAKKYL